MLTGGSREPPVNNHTFHAIIGNPLPKHELGVHAQELFVRRARAAAGSRLGRTDFGRGAMVGGEWWRIVQHH